MSSMVQEQTTAPSAVANGSAWAAILAAGVGCAAMGIITDVAEGIPRISKALTLSKPVGNLSGETTLAVVVWVIAWVVLHVRWKSRRIKRPGGVLALALGLILIGLVTTFPPFIELVTGQ